MAEITKKYNYLYKYGQEKFNVPFNYERNYNNFPY